MMILTKQCEYLSVADFWGYCVHFIIGMVNVRLRLRCISIPLEWAEFPTECRCRIQSVYNHTCEYIRKLSRSYKQDCFVLLSIDPSAEMKMSAGIRNATSIHSTHWNRKFADDTVLCIENNVFCFKFHQNLFPRGLFSMSITIAS